jgi:hypothetical protein
MATLITEAVRLSETGVATGNELAFGICAIAALVGAGVAAFVTPPRRRRRERLVPAEAAD